MSAHLVVGRLLARPLFAALAAASALTPAVAVAQTLPSASADAAPSQNATVNLIRALVRKNILSQSEADQMIAQAEAEAGQARATAQAAQSAQTSAQNAVAAASPASAQPGTSVRYVPQFVRDQIKDEVKQEVLADAKKEGLVGPDALPDWVRGIKITGDLRVRTYSTFFAKGNALDFVNVGAINAGQPFNTDPSVANNNPPILNSSQNRTTERIRARLGLEADVTPKLSAIFRVATGDQPGPVSTDAALGGYFDDKSIWLDRAYFDYRPVEGAHVFAGRMANPFRLPELVWDPDVNLDGFAVSYEHPIGDKLTLFGLAGYFPLQFVPDDFPTAAFSDEKVPSTKNKFMSAGQIGAQWHEDSGLSASLYASYYRYSYVEGALSPSCENEAQYCLTDNRRPGFLQKGNTLFALRDIFTLDPTDTSSPQYYGLASQFHVLDVSGDVTVPVGSQLAVNVAGHFADNLGYNVADIERRAFNPASGISQIVNNNESCSVALVGGVCPNGDAIFKSGSTAWLVRATIGTPKIEHHGDWSLSASYRRIDPDALLDAFTDSDFHLGGTNAKGWTIGATYGLMKNTSLSARWYSADQVYGPPFRVDVLMVDLDTKF